MNLFETRPRLSAAAQWGWTLSVLACIGWAATGVYMQHIGGITAAEPQLGWILLLVAGAFVPLFFGIMIALGSRTFALLFPCVFGLARLFEYPDYYYAGQIILEWYWIAIDLTLLICALWGAWASFPRHRFLSQHKPTYNRWLRWLTFGGMSFAGFGALIVLLVAIEESGLASGYGVIRGSEMNPKAMDWLRKNGVLGDYEVLHFFYSAGQLTIHGDGNIVTADRVISYYIENGERVVIDATYEAIDHLEPYFSDSWFEDGQIWIALKDEELGGFSLLVPSIDEGDELFYDAILTRLRALRLEAPAVE